MELVFAADLHLRAHTWARHPEIAGDARESWQHIWTYCEQHAKDVAGLILGGDVFDARPEAGDVECYLTGVHALARAGIKIYAIQGQHGYSKEIPWTSVDPVVHWLHGGIPVQVGGMQLAGFDTQSPEELKERLNTLDPKVEVLVLHQACRGSLPSIEGVQNWDFELEWVPAHVRLVLAGDIHKPWERTITRTNKLEQPTATRLVYSGSTCMQALDEAPSKSFLTITLPTLSVARVPLATRPFLAVTIETETQLAEALSNIARLPEGALVHLRYGCQLTGIEEQAREANPKINLISRLLPSPSMNPGQLELSESPEAPTMGQCLSALVKPDERPVLYRLVEQLLASKTPRELLQQARQEFLKPQG